MLKIFTKYAIEQPGNWLSPGGKYKKFISSNSDLIFTWNYELGTLSFKGEMGDRLKELFITVCTTGKSLPAERSGFEHVALNNDEPLSVSRTKTKAARVSTDNDSARSSNHVSSVQKSKCDCQCGLLAAELEGVKLDLVILQKNVDTRITSAQKTHDDEVTQLKHIYAKERERCELLESDISILVRGRDREINELNNIIVLLENKVESIEALNASLRKSISEQSTKYIQNNYDMNKTSYHVNNYANLKPFSTSDDIYIKSSNNIEHSPLRLPNYFVKKETTNDHARTETICQSREVPAEYPRHNRSLNRVLGEKNSLTDLAQKSHVTSNLVVSNNRRVDKDLSVKDNQLILNSDNSPADLLQSHNNNLINGAKSRDGQHMKGNSNARKLPNITELKSLLQVPGVSATMNEVDNKVDTYPIIDGHHCSLRNVSSSTFNVLKDIEFLPLISLNESLEYSHQVPVHFKRPFQENPGQKPPPSIVRSHQRSPEWLNHLVLVRQLTNA